MSSRALMHRSSSNHAAAARPLLRQRLAEQCVHCDPATALGSVLPALEFLGGACLGSVSEIREGDAPHLPLGCVAQASGVAEMLRVWRALADSEVRAP